MKKIFVVCPVSHELREPIRQALPSGEFTWLFFDEVGAAKKYLKGNTQIDIVICSDSVSPILQSDGLQLALYCQRSQQRVILVSDAEVKGMPYFPKKEIRVRGKEFRAEVEKLLIQPVVTRKVAQAIVFL